MNLIDLSSFVPMRLIFLFVPLLISLLSQYTQSKGRETINYLLNAFIDLLIVNYIEMTCHRWLLVSLNVNLESAAVPSLKAFGDVRDADDEQRRPFQGASEESKTQLSEAALQKLQKFPRCSRK